ncbi:MAG: DNA-directed DNA polymerase II small subunit [Candidatus Micrarchaeia archaeon]|jgi:DNA polymerase II small subunit
MEGEEFIQEILNKGMRLTPEALELVEKIENKKNTLNLLIEGNFKIITKDDIESIISEYEKIPEPEVEIRRSDSFEPIAKEYSPRIRLYPDKDITNNSRCTGKPEDFVAYFRSRMSMMKSLLHERMGENPIIKISDLRKRPNEGVRLIGMIVEIRTSQKGNLILEVEDEEDIGLVIVTKSDKDLFDLASKITLDDILLFDGKVYNGLLMAKEINWPDIPIMKEKKKIEEDLAVAYLSDLHVGSRFFLEKEFNKFLDWLNGNERDKELAGKIKYISISGDIADGIGAYPGQEEELIVKDIYKQYEIFSDLMEKVPDYIKIIVSPGNHDAVRRAQPQPQISDELLKGKGMLKVGSPSWVDLEGFKHLIYHGDSLDSIISSLSNCDYAHPEIPMIELLKRRNLSPIYGKNVIVPEKKDYLMIDEVPDILHMGHIHKNAYSVYRGVHIINSGTFQERTEFQIKQGHIPTPGIVPILLMKTGEVIHKKFIGENNG